MREVVFDIQSLDDLKFWIKNDKKLAIKIIKLIETLPKDPFSGMGKPEPLKFELQGCWSRRINIEHRLVYEVTDSHIRILSCRYHY